MSAGNSSIYSDSGENVGANVGLFFLLFGAVIAFAFGISFFQRQG